MPRRRKRKPPRPARKKPESGPLAQAIAPLIKQLQDARKLPSPPVEPDQPASQPREVTEAELMELVYASLVSGDPLDLETLIELPVASRPPRPAPVAPPPAPTPDNPEQPPPAPRQKNPLSAGLETLHVHAFSGQQWRDHLPNALRQLQNQPLTPPQQSLLKRAVKAAPLPALNIRQLPRDRALEQVATFLAQQRQAGKKFARVITGKGLSSRGDPVLKPAVIAYCEGPGAADVTAWAPERDRQGAFGSIVIRLRSRHQSRPNH